MPLASAKIPKRTGGMAMVDTTIEIPIRIK
jgi:hypothetical protein